jgi:hypothetical protein
MDGAYGADLTADWDALVEAKLLPDGTIYYSLVQLVRKDP